MSHIGKLDEIREVMAGKEAFISDMDGVIYHGNHLLPGAREFVAWLKKENKKYLFLTNSSERSARELAEKLGRLGLDVDESHFYTSALSTALFLSQQCPAGSAYVIGQPGLINALYSRGFSMNDVNPDYVVVGFTRDYSYEKIAHAVKLVQKGARLIGTDLDTTNPTMDGFMPSTGALIAPIAQVAGVRPYFCGKPNPLMMRNALMMLDALAKNTVILGDRMDTDIIAGIESGITTVLVLSGVTQSSDLIRHPYMPTYVLGGLAEFVKVQEVETEQ
ncbi:HAD-IIA family hydrolase [Candidatus Haliotispira prima]|uniref:HAD-IIA family hydrolase n=1 Tax=Candidatus Haliotispira prima TaxID=3034016 RepID=A0ABY8MDP3_9SPIO|nr:HAD-IIA family hydrolase [Candidatus Haliotispira prima]